MASDTTTTKGTAETMTPWISDNLTATAAPTDGDDVFTFVLYEVAVPILYGVVTLLGVTGNSLVIYVIASKERMRTVTNFLIRQREMGSPCACASWTRSSCRKSPASSFPSSPSSSSYRMHGDQFPVAESGHLRPVICHRHSAVYGLRVCR